MVSRHAVAAQKREVFDIGGGFRLLAVHAVGEADVLDPVARHAKAQRERLAGRGAAVALPARHLAHSGIEEPGALRARFLAFAGLGGSEIAVRQALLKDRFGHLPVQSQTFGLPVLFVPARSSQRSPSKIEFSDASVLRSTSVSSMRRIIVPPLWRA